MATSSNMPPIVTAGQMRNIDKRAIEGMGIPGLDLMDAAGRGAAEHIRDDLLSGEVEGVTVAVICGRGNNGGDGFVCGRYLAEWGANVGYFLLGETARLKGDALANYERLSDKKAVVEILTANDLPVFSEYDILVDAIFGIGFKRKLEGVAADVVRAINDAGKPVVAVDIASGLIADTGQVEGDVVSAEMTVTFGCAKIGHYLYPGRGLTGMLKTVDIGLPPRAIDDENSNLFLISDEYVNVTLPERAPDAHKGSCGKVFILAGSKGMTGAAALAGNAAVRSGAGLVYVGCPESLNDILEVKLTEALTRPLPEVRKKRTLARRALGEVMKYIADVDALAVGPGVSLHFETQELIQRVIARRDKPTVLDADGINAFAKDNTVLKENSAPLVITPHVGELSRIVDAPIGEIIADRKTWAQKAAKMFNCVCLLKGAPTFVADPDGTVCLNPTGNAGMASGGTGDVLTGIIVALLGQGLSPLDATCCGAYLHGMAGDLAADELGQTSMAAGDMVDALPEVFLHFRL
jgi:NAD(P)H-hydrate epimerase